MTRCQKEGGKYLGPWNHDRWHPKNAFFCRFWTQTATWRPNHTILTSSVKAILKAMIDTVFLGPSLGGSEVNKNGRSFLQKERVLWGWLAGPSHIIQVTCSHWLGWVCPICLFSAINDKKGFINLHFLQDLSHQKPIWDKARRYSLQNKRYKTLLCAPLPTNSGWESKSEYPRDQLFPDNHWGLCAICET